MLPKELKELSNLSQELGKNLDLIQGAGGNTSVKVDDALWVKSSGHWLIDANEKNIFVPVNYRAIRKNLDKGVKEPVESEIIQFEDTKNLRPSIETTLHAVMPQKYVAHTHSINSIVNSISEKNIQTLGNKLKGMNWGMIDYVKPGLSLTKKLRDLADKGLNIIILANHGIVIASNDIIDLREMIYEVEDRLYTPLRVVDNRIDYETLNKLIKNTNYTLPKYELVHLLAKDHILKQAISIRALYPDHVVFIGPGPMPLFDLNSIEKNIGDQKDERLILIDGLGLVVNKNSNENLDAMLYCLSSTLLRIQQWEKLKYLSENDEMELVGWDAEKYRQSIARKRDSN